MGKGLAINQQDIRKLFWFFKKYDKVKFAK